VAGRSDLLELRVRALLDELAAAESPLPGGGAAAALTTGMAAGLLAMVARRSDDWDESRAAAAQAETLRRRALRLATTVERAYGRALEVLDTPPGDDELGTALERAADAPLRLADLAADVALLAADIAERGDPSLRPDAAVACVLAEAGARAGAELVLVNLRTTPNDERLTRAHGLAESAAAAARRTLQGS
jgi:formiminotetrahydrofolate cyclodeaminase